MSAIYFSEVAQNRLSPENTTLLHLIKFTRASIGEGFVLKISQMTHGRSKSDPYFESVKIAQLHQCACTIDPVVT